MSVLYFDRQGRPLTMNEWAALFDDMFGGPFDEETFRYGTDPEASAHHDQLVARMRDAIEVIGRAEAVLDTEE